MRKVVALLAAVLAPAALAACGDDGAEPGALESATLVLDFRPNAVHAGIYAALAEGYYRDAGVDLTVREPSTSTDAPKLLEAGRTQFAILDIHDLGLARERDIDVVGVMPIVQRPLAAVIARDPRTVQRPSDLEGERVGVTGLPSDDAVLDSVVSADGGDPAAVDRVTIGFNAVAALAGGRLDAATAFWNAEGVALRRLGVPTREFRVDRYSAPRYPELVLATTGRLLHDDPSLARAIVHATTRGYRFAVGDRDQALDDLLAAVNGLGREEQRAQLQALLAAHALARSGRFDPEVLRSWSRWDAEHGILARPIPVGTAFETQVGR